MIVIIDYGIGNITSIVNMFSRIGVKAKISGDLPDIESAQKLILPGVGAFNSGMRNLLRGDLVSLLNKKVLIDKVPVLGICLGMQLMTKGSEEGTMPGLGWFDAATRRFILDNIAIKVKIPHMGWNSIQVKKNNILFNGIDENARFYFLHSYHITCNDQEDILATSFYGYEFTAAINRGNIFGIQFHPEKSHKFGMRMLKNFSNL